MDTLGPIVSVLMIKVSSVYMIKHNLGPQHKGVYYAGVPSVLINKFHCIHGVGVYKVANSYSIIGISVYND